LWSQLLRSAQAVEPFLTFLFAVGWRALLGGADGLEIAGARRFAPVDFEGVLSFGQRDLVGIAATHAAILMRPDRLPPG
jgi:hypothetical protein